jgi:hypothetical protein
VLVDEMEPRQEVREGFSADRAITESPMAESTE